MKATFIILEFFVENKQSCNFLQRILACKLEQAVLIRHYHLGVDVLEGLGKAMLHLH